MTNGEIIGNISLEDILIKIRLENTVCPVRAFYPGERKADVLSFRCAEYGFYSAQGAEKGACVHCISDFLSEEAEI